MPQVQSNRWLPGCLLALTLLIYLARLLWTGVPFLGGGGDTLPTRLLAVSLLREGNFDLDEFTDLRPDTCCPYYLQYLHGHYYTVFPIGGPIILTGVFACLHTAGLDVLTNEAVRDLAVAVTAATLSALSVLVVFLTYARRGVWQALAVAAIYGLGTGVWPMCAQDLWQQTYGVFLMSLCLFCLERGWDDDRWLGWMGLSAGWLFLVRPGNGLLIATLAVAILVRKPRQLVRFAALSIGFLLLTLWYNLHFFDALFGGNSAEAGCLKPFHFLAEGLPGLLISPSHGLFVYSPVCVLAGLAVLNKDPERRSLRWILIALVGVQALLYGSYGTWHGGYCYGPRFLLEVMPACAGLLWYAWPRLVAYRLGQTLLALTVLWSVLANGAGYVYGWYQWCSHPDVDRCQERLWDWRDNPLMCVVFGLPPRCPYPLRPTGQGDEIAGVRMELGRGWSTEECTNLYALGSEAELLLDFQRQPVGQIVLDLRAEPGLARPQIVTALLNDRMKARLSIVESGPQYLVIPIEPADLAALPQRLTLQFAAYHRRSILDLRPIAAEVKGIFVGLRERSNGS